MKETVHLPARTVRAERKQYKIEIAAEADVQQEDFIWDNPEIGVFVGG